MNILVTLPNTTARASFFSPKTQEELETLGAVAWNPNDKNYSPAALREALKDVEICITGWGCPVFDDFVLENAQKLRLVAHTGGSVGSLVSPALYRRGVRVISANPVFARSVAEGTLAYMLAALRKIPRYDRLVHEGGWRDGELDNRGLWGRSVSLIGFGDIAKELCALLRPFEVKILAYDPFVPEETMRQYGAGKVEMDAAFEQASIVSLHLPATPQTRHLVGAAQLRRMPGDAVFINTARGSIVNEAELAAHLLQNPGSQAVLDVFETEPLPPDSPLRQMDNVILIPHMGGPTADMRLVAGEYIVRQVGQFITKPDSLEYIGEERAMRMTRASAQAGRQLEGK